MLRILQVDQNSCSSLYLSKFLFVCLILANLAFNTGTAQSVLIARTVTNTTHCSNANTYGAWLDFSGIGNYYELSNGSFTEYSDGTAHFTGTITNNTNTAIIFEIDATLSGRTFSTPSGSPKASNCGNGNTADWYYYTATSGTFTGSSLAEGALLSFERFGPSFQIGTGANQTEGSNIFGACGWLDITVDSQPDDKSLVLNSTHGDFNINLSGNPLTICDDLTYGGKIGGYEIHGGSFTAAINSIEDPTGGSGTIQYMWLKTTDPDLPISQWTEIAGAENSSYDPGEISETTYFLRCSRRLGCSAWPGESNIIAKIINGNCVNCNGGAYEELEGNIIAITANNDIDFEENITGTVDENFAQFYDFNDYLTVTLNDELVAGDQVTVSWKMRNYTSSYPGNAKLIIHESIDDINYSYNTTLETSLKKIIVHQTVTLNGDAKYLKLSIENSTPDFEVDAISYSLRTCATGSIGDRVWEDLNGNGAQDEGEPGLAGVFVFLEDEYGNPIPGIDFDFTDSLGSYLFDNLPIDKYIVRFATPGGYLPTLSPEGVDPALNSDASYLDGRSGIVDLSIEENDTTIDAGYIMPVQLVGIVWYDENENGLQENEEAVVEGVFVTLYNAGTDMLAGTGDDVKFGDYTTGADGFYEFNNVFAGNYYVVFDTTTLPLGYTFTDANIGSNNYIDSDADVLTGFTDVFPITSGKDESGVDAGLVLSCGFIPAASIGDATCEDFPVDFEGLPNESGYSYYWEFLDDVTNPVVIGTSNSRLTDFTWLNPGDKIYKLTVTNTTGCSVTKTGVFSVLPAEESSCLSLLPVELIDFTAGIIDDNKVQLKWATAWEQNNNFFEIQRSTDGDRFQTIGSVIGRGTTELINLYDFLDEAPFYGRNYYRLKQIDFDGTVDFSGVVSVLIDNEELPDVIVYPNPTKDFTTLRVVTPFEEDATVEIVNVAGQILEVISIEAGTNSQEINLAKYQPGFYFLNIKYNGFRKLVHRILKVRD